MNWVIDQQVTLDPYNQNKLCAHIALTTEVPVQYRYRVVGKTPDTDFSYSSQKYNANFKIPVVGLYANYLNTVEVTLNDMSNNREVVMFTIDTTGQDYGNTLLKIEYTILDQQMFDQTVAKGWVVNAFMDGYDKNGDLRMTGIYDGVHNYLKNYDNSFYVGSGNETESTTFARSLRKVGLMGDTRLTFALPDDRGAHHDVVPFRDGSLFVLTSYLEPFSDTKRGRCEITRFDNNTGELLWRRDYSSIYDGQYVLKNTQVPSDAHWNSLEYVERFNLVIISSRTSSHILMMDATTGDVRYNIANLNSQSPVLSVGQALTPDNLTEFEYGCGQHTVWYTNNPAYASSNTASSMVLTVFDNASCLYSDGVTFQEQPMDDDPTDFTGYDFPTRALVYKIDFDTNKLTLLSSQSFEGRYCEYMGSIYDINNYFCIGLPIKPPSTHVYMDQVMMVYGANKDVGVICEKVAAAGNYRTRIFTYEELKAMI